MSFAWSCLSHHRDKAYRSRRVVLTDHHNLPRIEHRQPEGCLEPDALTPEEPSDGGGVRWGAVGEGHELRLAAVFGVTAARRVAESKSEEVSEV